LDGFLVLSGDRESGIGDDDVVVFKPCAGREANKERAMNADVFGAKDAAPATAK
jgi:hypothetical protein